MNQTLTTCLLMVGVLAGGLRAADLTDPANATLLRRWGYLNVVAYGADPAGQRDSTKAIQHALDDGYAQGLAVLVPLGTYVISEPLRCYKSWSQAAGRKNVTPFPNKFHTVVGENRDGRRPHFRLAAHAPTFDDAESPKAMINFAAFCTADRPWSEEEINRIDPMKIPYGVIPPKDGVVLAAADVFDDHLIGIDFDCGGHAGAVGVLFPAAQKSVLADVKVNATGAHTGIHGIPGRNMGAINIEVVGGRFGLVITPSTAGATVVGLRLAGQTERALVTRDFVPFCVVGFDITKESGPVIATEGRSNTAIGTIALIDGAVTLARGGTAVDNRIGKSLYARNVFVRGTREFVRSGAENARGGGGEWFRVAEYCYTDQQQPDGAPPYAAKSTVFLTFSVIAGTVSQVPEPVAVIEDGAAPPADLVRRHLPAVIPRVTFHDSMRTLNIADAPFNAVPDGRDNSAAIQHAIDEGARSGRVVFVPKGKFLVARTLKLKAKTTLIGLGPRRNERMLLCEIAAHPSWKIGPDNDSLIATVDDAAAETFLGFLNLGAPKGARNHIHWRAGRRSEMLNLGFTGAFSENCVYFSGHGGGRVFLVEPQLSPASQLPREHRHIRIEGTIEPLAWYGCNLEAGRKVAANLEITGASNLRFYGIKREGHSPTLILNDCRNVGFFTLGAMREGIHAGSGGYVQLQGDSDGILAALVLVQQNLEAPNGEPLLRESYRGRPPVAIAYPDSISLYKRGELDDRQMRLAP